MSSISEAAETEILDEAADRRRLNALMFRKLMPLLVFGYILNFLDRTNIALAKRALEVDIGISAAAYGLGAGLFFLAYSLCEVPSNLILQKVGARAWITRIMASWGLVSACMAFVQGPTSFYVLRVMLGVAEAGLFPGVLLYLTYWFGHRERARAIGYFLLGVCLANVIGGPIGGALLELDGLMGLRGWQWMFLLEGLPACLFAVVVWVKLPNGPAEAPWLTKTEAQSVLRRLEQEREEAKAHGGAKGSLAKVFVDPQVMLAILVYFLHQIAVYSVTFFLPGIIGSWGDLSDLTVGLLTALPWTTAAIGAAFIPRLAVTLFRQRLIMIGGLFLMAAALLTTAFSSPAVGLVAFCVATFTFFPVQSVLFTYPSARFRGAALAGGLGFLNSCGILGGFVGPSVMGLVEKQTGQATNGLILVAIGVAIAGAAAFGLRQPYEDKPRA